MNNLSTNHRTLAAAAVLLALPGLAQDPRTVVTNAPCSVEVVAGPGGPLGALKIENQARTYEATLEKVGDWATLEGQKPYTFTFTRVSSLPGKGYDFWLKFTVRTGAAYQCHVISRMMGDKIDLKDDSWAGKQGMVAKSTDPNKTLLTIKFK